MPSSSLIVVDIGNARIKLGCFAVPCAATPAVSLPEPDRTLSLSSHAPQWAEVVQWLSGLGDQNLSWWIGSVNRPAASRLLDWLRIERPQDRVTLLAAGDLPLTVAVARPDMVGVDRLLDAVAANRLRAPGRPAVVIDVGTAITVDALSADGVFLGGAILPGIGMSARALHEFTDLLPLIDVEELAAPPPALGGDTEAAMQSGLFWGAVGAIRELVDRMADGARTRPQVFLTGGAGPIVADLLGSDAQHVPHLTLSGIALVARSDRAWQ